MSKYVLFDTETTGNQEEDRIIQFGGMVVHSDGKLDCYDNLCYSPVPIKIEAMEVHNLVPDMIIGQPLATETVFYKKLKELNIPDNYIIAHNIKFDMGMINKEGFVNNMTMIDTLRCAKHLYSELPSHRLQYMRYALELYKIEEAEAAKYGITIKAHDALGDVLVMKLFLSCLINKCKEIYAGENPIKKLAELTLTPVLIKTFKFGKHKGVDIADVAKTDQGYLVWMINNMADLDEDLKYTINFYLKR